MAIGLYRTNDGLVQVAYGRKTTFPISRKRYEEQGYQPPFETLPAEQDAGAISEKVSKFGTIESHRNPAAIPQDG